MSRRLVKRVAACVAACCVTLTVCACSPLDVLAYLAGCESSSSTTTASSSSVAVDSASGEWTELLGKTMSQLTAAYPSEASACSSYDYGFQCTWWACVRQRMLGHDIGRQWGNGQDWGASAQAAGWQQGAAVGGIAVFKAGAAGSSAIYGHVAVIEQIDGDTLHISEGGTGFGSVHTRTFSVSNPPAGVTYWHPTSSSGSSSSSGGSTTTAGSDDSASSSWTCDASSSTVTVDYDGDGTHATPSEAQAIAKQMIASGYKDWDNDDDWQALVWIWNHESGWRWDAENASSGAYGIPQSLPGSKMASAGDDWKDNAATQIKWGLNYISERYGSPSKAKQFWLSHNWY